MRLLDDEQLDRVYLAEVRAELFDGVSSSPSPRLIMVGGQPGAGKTAAVLVAASELRGEGRGVAVINGDELRPLHPLYADLVAQDRSTAASKTGADLDLWVERGIREAAGARYSTVLETTMRRPEAVEKTLRQFQAAGHHVEMRVLVVHPEISTQAIYARFELGLRTPDALARFTLPEFHAAALERMPDTLKTAQRLADRVRLVSRQGEDLYDSTRDTDTAVKRLAALRKEPLSEAERAKLAAEWGRLADALDKEGVPDLVRRGVRAEQRRVATRPRSTRERDR